MKMKRTLPVFSASALMLVCAGATASEPNVETIPGVAPPGMLKDRSLEEYEHWRRPAPADSRPASDFVDNYANDVGDGLFFAPGVWVNALDINEPRIVLRGFGVGNRQERSTVPVLRDGAPLTDVHGTTNVQEIDLLAVSRIDVFRGGGGDLRFTGDNLGGAVNLISPTGLTTTHGRRARIDAGSSIEGTPGGQGHVDIAGADGALDYYASLTALYETGFRDNNQRNNGVFNANLGWRPSDRFSTRFFVEAVYSDTELAGGLSPADAADPSLAAAPIGLGPLFPGGPLIELAGGAEDDEFARELFTGRLSNLTEFRLFAHDVDARFHFARREVESPQIDFVGVLDEAGNEWGANLVFSRDTGFFNIDTTYRVGASYSTGSQSSDRFENIDGEKGDQFVNTEHNSTNISGFVEAALRPFKRLIVDLGGKFVLVDRELTVDDGDTPDDARFIGVAARGGAVYELAKNIQAFANASRTYEPPSFSELISDNPEGYNGLDEQDAFTYEAGFRGGHSDWLGWDITYFHTDVENEIVNMDDPEFNGIGTLVNVDATTHKGVEAGLDINLRPAMTRASGQALTLRSAYSYNNFIIDDAGPLGGVDGNRLAGVPQHIYRGELRYDADGRWFAAVNVQLAGGAFYADHENLVSVPTYTLVGFSAGKRLNDNMEVFLSGENVTDIDYAAGVTPVLSQAVQDGRIFTPGNRASIYGGLRYRF